MPPYRPDDEQVSLRVYIEGLIQSLQKNIFEKLEAQSRMIDKVEGGMDRRMTEISSQFNHRLEQMNEYKETTRRMLTEKADSLDMRIRAIESQVANWQGRLVVLGAVWGLFAVVVSVLLNYFLRTYH